MRSKKSIYNIITNLALQVIVILYGFIVPKVIISTFGSATNGLISSITQFLAYISLLESGFGPVVKAALYKPIAEKNSEKICNILKASERFFRIIALIFILYMIVLCFVYPNFVSYDFDWFYTASLILIIGIGTFAEYFFGITYGLLLQAKQKKYIISIIQIITYIVSTIVVVIMAKAGFNIHIIKLVTGLVFLIRPIIQNMYVRKKYSIDLKNCSGHYKVEKKWDGLAQHIAYVIHTKTDITVLTIFTNLVEVSVYSVYYLVIKGVKSIVESFTSGIDAVFGEMIAKAETKNLQKKFSMYEVIYSTISTIVFSVTIILIVPFVAIYTKNITDADYIRPLFGVLIVISEMIWSIRLPYTSIIFAAGHFKETRIGAWVECFTNIVLSVFLVNYYGIVGVAIGTIAAMAIRTVEFVYHANRYILKRSLVKSVKVIVLTIIETIMIVLIGNKLLLETNGSYIMLVVNGIIMVSIASIMTMTVNYLFFGEELREMRKMIKRLLRKREKKNNKER